MPTITLSVPEDMKKGMDELTFVNWSAIAREAFQQKMAEFALMKAIASKSKLTEKDASSIADKISESLAKEYKRKFSLK
jgi:hypothetical protein